MQISISLDSAHGLKGIASQLSAAAKLFATAGNAEVEPDGGKGNGKPGRPKGAKNKPKEADADLGLGDEGEETEDGEETGDDLGLGGDGEETEDDAPTIEQVIAAAREYKGRHGLEKTTKIIQRFGVKNLKQLPEDKLALALKAFSK